MSSTDGHERIKIDSKIISVSVVSEEDKQPKKPPEPEPEPPKLTALKPHARPSTLFGTTYKIKPGNMTAALYVTINNLELPDGTKRPVEIFLNTKDVAHSQWRMAVSRLLSALFRQPLPFEFAIEELKQIPDPEGPYFFHKNDPAGRGKCLGVVAHIAKIVETHCQGLGLLEEKEQPIPAEVLTVKYAEAKATGAPIMNCPKCHENALVMLDGCWTCTSCGESKCG